jgi:hypothetical protein
MAGNEIPAGSKIIVSRPPNKANAANAGLMDPSGSTADERMLRDQIAVSVNESSIGTVIVEADEDADDFKRRLKAVLADTGAARLQTLLVCAESERAMIESILATEFPPLPVMSLSPRQAGHHAAQLFSRVKTDKVAFLSVRASYTPPQWEILGPNSAALGIWVPDMPFPEYTATAYSAPVRSWLASTELLLGLDDLNAFSKWSLLHVADTAKRAGRSFRWLSPRAFSTKETEPEPPAGKTPRLALNSSVLALVPHYKCERWLDECLHSLVRQTRPLDAIVVIDDNSAHPPVEIVSKYPDVTLLQAAKNSGPYALSQQVINDTDYDAYLFMDADDWATDDRLEILLTEAERTGAELIGSQLVRVFSKDVGVAPTCYPLDVSRVYKLKQSHPITHPTTMVTRELIQRVGGFSTALRFGADSEFLRRVGLTARIVNSARFCYFQRHRDDSLTEAPETGFGSPARETLMGNLREWAENNKEALTKGTRPVKPYAVTSPVRLEHRLGPQLEQARP